MANTTKPKLILGIETSCDETGVSVGQITNNGVKLLSNVVASSASIHVKYGGIVPEQAAREQIKSIIPVIQEALSEAQITHQNLDAIAVTFGPGLIGSLLVGVETAKTLALLWNKPLIPVNHLLAHFYAAWIDNLPRFPFIGLLVSGGHTDIILMKDHGKYKYLGGTRDDAAGECFDKCARLLDLPYPGGPNLSKLAESGDPKTVNLPRPMFDSGDFDLSFSGLKTAVANIVNPEIKKEDLAASIEDTITDVLVKKTIAATQRYNIDQIIVSGGVAANKVLKEKMEKAVDEHLSRDRLFIPKPQFCTDNGAVIASYAFYNYHPIDPLKLQADPSLSLF